MQRPTPWQAPAGSEDSAAKEQRQVRSRTVTVAHMLRRPLLAACYHTEPANSRARANVEAMRVLCAVDGSASAREAASWAAQAVVPIDALHLLSVTAHRCLQARS